MMSCVISTQSHQWIPSQSACYAELAGIFFDIICSTIELSVSCNTAHCNDPAEWYSMTIMFMLKSANIFDLRM